MFDGDMSMVQAPRECFYNGTGDGFSAVSAPLAAVTLTSSMGFLLVTV